MILDGSVSGVHLDHFDLSAEEKPVANENGVHVLPKYLVLPSLSPNLPSSWFLLVEVGKPGWSWEGLLWIPPPSGCYASQSSEGGLVAGGEIRPG